MAMHRITDNIFLGSVYSLSPGNLANHKITYLLSVLRQNGVPAQYAAYLTSFDQNHLVIDIEDVEDENIMQHFATTDAFIDEAVNSGNNILIHCIAGISRSVTCTAAYLMRHNNWTAEQALEYIKSKRHVANPNASFREQLDVYYDCGYEVSPKMAPYRRYLLKRQSEEAKFNKIAHVPDKVVYTSESTTTACLSTRRVLQLLTDKLKLSNVSVKEGVILVVGSDDSELVPSLDDSPLLVKAEVSKRDSGAKIVLRIRGSEDIDISDEIVSLHHQTTPSKKSQIRCKKCRNPLAASHGFVLHTPKDSTASFAPRNGLAASSSLSPSCMQYFVEPVSWMRPELEQGKLEGKLSCPKCSSKIGSYHWQGEKCSCGLWVTPAIQIQRARVDEVLIRKAGL